MLAGLVEGNSRQTTPTFSASVPSVKGTAGASPSSNWQRGPTMPSAMMPIPACQRRMAASNSLSMGLSDLPSTAKALASAPNSLASALRNGSTSLPWLPSIKRCCVMVVLPWLFHQSSCAVPKAAHCHHKHVQCENKKQAGEQKVAMTASQCPRHATGRSACQAGSAAASSASIKVAVLTGSQRQRWAC